MIDIFNITHNSSYGKNELHIISTLMFFNNHDIDITKANKKCLGVNKVIRIKKMDA